MFGMQGIIAASKEAPKAR